MININTNKVITDEDIKKYDTLIDYFIRKCVIKNWKEVSMHRNDENTSLGNSGYTIADIRQHLRCEVAIALRNYKPDKGTKESSFCHTHLNNRVGQLMKKLASKTMGYGQWCIDINEALGEAKDE